MLEISHHPLQMEIMRLSGASADEADFSFYDNIAKWVFSVKYSAIQAPNGLAVPRGWWPK